MSPDTGRAQCVHAADPCNKVKDRHTITLDAMFPFPEDRSALPRFLGWDRLDWARAPDPIVAHFGLSEHVEAWRAALAELADELPQAHRLSQSCRPLARA